MRTDPSENIASLDVPDKLLVTPGTLTFSTSPTLAGLADLDGFYTFVVGTRTGFAVLRDSVCCKPAVMAETEDWVAFGSEYRALADLPGIGGAKVWEPAPAKVYAWDQAA